MPPSETPETAPFWTEPLAAPPAPAGALRLGVTESFLETLGPEGRALEVVGLELAPAGARLRRGDSLGMLHLPTRAVDLRAPFALTVLARNDAALADPRRVRTSPYMSGWLAEVMPES